jgi:hypothetical protein
MKTPHCIPSGAMLLIALVFAAVAQASLIYNLPFENGASASLTNFGTPGGTAISVASPYNIAPAPSAKNSPVRIGLWSRYFTPNLSGNVSYAGAVLLPGSTSQFRMNTTGSAMTISTWIRWDGTVGTNNRYGIANTLNSSQNSGWSFYVDNTGRLGYVFTAAESGGNYSRSRQTVSPVISVGQWTHVALTWNASLTNSSAVQLYVNGIAQSTTGAALSTAVAVPGNDPTLGALDIAVGSFNHSPGAGGSFSFHGHLDDFATWDAVLPAARLRAIATAPDVLPVATVEVMDELFYIYDSANTAGIGGVVWSKLTGFDTTGRSLGDTWKGADDNYYIWLAGNSTTPVGLIGKPEPKRKLFAHYMGCYPIGYGALPYHMSRFHLDNNPYGTNYLSALGGSLVNWPLLPQGLTLTPAQSAELEIKRAIRGGIDGFAVDAWAGGDTAKATLNELFAAAQRLGVQFELTICLDPSTHVTPPDGVMIQPFANSINWLLTNHGASPHLARRDGKVLIFGYGSNGILRSPEFSTPPLTVEKCAQIAAAYTQLRAAVSEPLFIHYDFDNTYLKAPGDVIARAQWAAQNFEAVGGFLGTDWSQNPAVVQTVVNNGAEWSQPLFPQYNNKLGSLWVEPGTNKLRAMHQAARDSGSTLIQFVTWNDYGEDTVLAPGYSTNYTLLTLNRHLADWWKTGLEPKVEQDQIHLIFRRSTDYAPTFPFFHRRTAPGVLEVTTLLKEPATITVPGYGAPYLAPIGLHVKQFPLQVGSVSASALRNGNTIASVTAPEQITDKPMREDNAMVCHSSNFLNEWTADFGSTTPLHYAENGDLDGDGLPNWFEMFYFGQFPLMSTAQSASASADPDNDGRTNLQEYLAQTDPTIADTPYAVGYVWDTSHIESRGISYNPDRDSRRRDVWYYLYRHGPAGNIPHNGNYPRMTTSGVNISYAGLMAHLSPTTDPDGVPYAALQGWIARRQPSPGSWQTLLRPRNNAAAILGWRSPVTGTVSLTFNVAEVGGMYPFTIDIGRNQEVAQLATLSRSPGQTGSLSLPSITVTKGDFIHLFAHSSGTYGSAYGYLDNIRFTLQSVTSQ